ncbi:MAG: CCA tRNA nucleotidyltransferase [Dehalococcoidales bacterium]|nr:CCA tRNA nucleotidyltransferase [Dehalococcoidales bacterium]
MIATNLASKLKEGLPAELAGFMKTAAELAAERGLSLYLVGGVVRDLLLGKPNFDLDLVVEGDAVALARELAGIKAAKITTHPRFKTAKLTWAGLSVDFTTARSESYEHPGALPTVTPGSLESDLFRRDFTINAMAVSLDAGRYGELIDHYGGQTDLAQRLIRVLHERSFTDDATRIWRALRYEQRLDFQLEEATLNWLKRDIVQLNTISGDRLRYELECVFREARPEKVLCRADELGVLQKLHPALRADAWLEDRFRLARKLTLPQPPSFALYLALLAYRLNGDECAELSTSLKLSKPVARVVHDAASLKAKIKALAYPEIKPSYVYRLLCGFSQSAVVAVSIAAASPVARQHLESYLHKLRYVKPALGGSDLIAMGVAPGPRVKELLERLRDARLNGEALSRQDEAALVKEWLTEAT